MIHGRVVHFLSSLPHRRAEPRPRRRKQHIHILGAAPTAAARAAIMRRWSRASGRRQVLGAEDVSRAHITDALPPPLQGARRPLLRGSLIAPSCKKTDLDAMRCGRRRLCVLPRMNRANDGMNNARFSQERQSDTLTVLNYDE